MSVYDDNANIKELQLSQNAASKVNITVDTYFQTEVKVSFIKGGAIATVDGGKSGFVGTVSQLRGKTIAFNGAATNPSGGQIKIVHTVAEDGGDSVVYTFPGDYRGTPDFSPADVNPVYTFFIKFI